MSSSRVPKSRKEDAYLQSEVASFASNLGFSSRGVMSPSSFNDSDFRKSCSIQVKSLEPRKLFLGPKRCSFIKKQNSYQKTSRSSKPIGSKTIRNSNFCDELKNLPELPLKNLPELPLLKFSAFTGTGWYEAAAELEEKVLGNYTKIQHNSEWEILVQKKKELGNRLLEQYRRDYLSSQGKSGNIRMLQAMLNSGTAADKVYALVVLINDNAVANLRCIDTLLGRVTSKVGKRHAFKAFKTLGETFIALLPDRKLKCLSQRPLNHLSDTRDGYSLLLFWHWEECIKQRYGRFVSALDEATLDTTVELKINALEMILKLLSSKPEEESRLLTSLVNKLGDPTKKVAASANFLLLKLLEKHPNMKVVVIDEAGRLLFRAHLGLGAKRNVVQFLNQIDLSNEGNGAEAAKQLIKIYFALLQIMFNDAGAPPYLGKHEKKYSRFSMTNATNGSPNSHVETDWKLFSAVLTGVDRAFPFISSSEAAVLIDVLTPSLFQLVRSRNFSIGLQGLKVLDKRFLKDHIVSDRFYDALYSKLLLPAAMISSKEIMFVDLLLGAMSKDINIKRVAAFSKRLLQVALHLPPEYACERLLLLSEVLKAHPSLWNMMLQNEYADEDLEHFEDITEDGDQPVCALNNNNNDNHVTEVIHGPQHDDMRGEYGLDKCQDHQGHISYRGYKPLHKGPSNWNADRVGWWELRILASHTHPSVSIMARTLLDGANIVYEDHPFDGLRLSSFLDKFIGKKSRQRTWYGASQIEPAKKLDIKRQLVGSEILSLAEADVPPEDVVFYKFYMEKLNAPKKSKKKNKKSRTEDEAAEELYTFSGEEDESENKEIEVNPFSEVDDREYTYDDFDKVAGEDDEDLIGGVSSDEEMGSLSDVEIGEVDDGGNTEVISDQRQKKRKSHGKSGTSPFVSLEDYQKQLRY